MKIGNAPSAFGSGLAKRRLSKMTEEEVKKAFEEKYAVTYIPPDRESENYEYIYALRYVRRGEKTEVFVELNSRQLMTDGKKPNCIMTVPIRNLSIIGAIAAKKKAKKTERHRYGQYGNVLLSDEQFEKLKEEFPRDWEARIDAVDCYVQQKGKGYDDYLAVIRNWARRDKERVEKNGAERKGFNNYTDTNKPDYSGFSEQILKEMLGE